jgi:Rieske 2Fe-2S family protein
MTASAPFSPAEIEALRRPFRGASLLPARAYHDQAVWDFERENWFFRDWVCVGRDEDAPEPGTFFRSEELGEPLVIVRARDGVLRAFYNVCQHRGTAVVEEQCGKAVRFQCPYHAWIYDLDGKLIRAKHTEDLDEFSFDTFGLKAVRLAVWQGFVFVSLDPDAPQLTPYDLGEDFFPDGPWKGGWMVFSEGCETMSMDGQRHGRPLLHATDEVDERRIYYYILWPNLIVSVHPDYVLTHQAWPAGPNRTVVNCDLYVDVDSIGDPGLDVSGARDFWDLTNKQDYHVVELQQNGTRSRSWVAGRYSNQEASVQAFDLMVADRYANDGIRSDRSARTEVTRPDRLAVRGGARAGARKRVLSKPAQSDAVSSTG